MGATASDFPIIWGDFFMLKWFIETYILFNETDYLSYWMTLYDYLILSSTQFLWDQIP